MHRLLLLTLPLAVLIIGMPAHAAQSTKAKQAVVIDFETGQVLLDKDAASQMPTSSMSKVMTIYMVFEALKAGTIDMDTEFKVSEKAWKKGGSKMFVELGKKIKVKDLIRGVIVQSGNDATIVLAEGLAGSEEKFAKAMTEKAHELGMKKSNFVNASGWPDPDHYSTAEDLTIMSKAMIKNFPEYYKFYSEKEFTYNNIKQPNRNPLLYRNLGADGLKTGHTEIGGYGLIGTAKNDDRRVIMVVNGLESEKDRADESARLITWALNNFENAELIQGKREIGRAEVAMGKESSVGIMLNETIKMTIPKGQKNNISLDIKYRSPLMAPIKQGQKIGTISMNIPQIGTKTYPLLATDNVEKTGFFKTTFTKIKYFIFGAE